MSIAIQILRGVIISIPRQEPLRTSDPRAQVGAIQGMHTSSYYLYSITQSCVATTYSISMHSFCCACPTRQFCDPPSELLLDLTGSIPGYRAYLLGQSLRGSPACTIGNTTPRKGSHFGISGPPQRDPSALGLAPPGGNPGEIRGGSHAPRPPPRDHGRATKRVSSASRRPADVYTQSTPPSPPHSPERDGNPWHPQAAPPRGRGCCGGAAGAQAGPPRRRRRPPRCSGGGGVQRRGRENQQRGGRIIRSNDGGGRLRGAHGARAPRLRE